MELKDVVMKLVGPVKAVGESNEDGRRLHNLQRLTDLVECLIGEIEEAAEDKDTPEASMNLIGRQAQLFLDETAAMLAERDK